MRKTIAILAVLAALSLGVFFLKPGFQDEPAVEELDVITHPESVPTLNPLLPFATQEYESRALEWVSKGQAKLVQRVQPAVVVLRFKNGAKYPGAVLEPSGMIVSASKRQDVVDAECMDNSVEPVEFLSRQEGVSFFKFKNPKEERQGVLLAEQGLMGERLAVAFVDDALETVQFAFSHLSGKTPKWWTFQKPADAKDALLFNTRGRLAGVQGGSADGVLLAIPAARIVEWVTKLKFNQTPKE